jgi:hypothetical protein
MTQPVNAWVYLRGAGGLEEYRYPAGRLGTLEDAQDHLARVLRMSDADLVEWYGFIPSTAEIWNDDSQMVIWKEGREA